MVTGLITDNRGVPITGPTVCQANTPNCTVADINGTFTLQLKKEGNMSIKVECLGFKPVEIAIDETTVFPLKITLTPMYNAEDMLSDVENNTAAKGIISISSLNIHCIFTDFSRFGPSIGTYNTDLMKFFALVGPEIGVSFSNIYTGLGIGLGYNYNDKYDTLAVDLKTSEYYINFGYSIVSSPSIRLTPMVSLRWLRFRVMNYSDERRISMNQYLDERDLDLRFNQAAAVAGINFDYLMYTDTFGAGDYWSFGAFGGFAMKLNRKPWIYSMGNRIMTDDQMIMKHLTFGVSIALYISASE
jgi:hypothetical protein